MRRTYATVMVALLAALLLAAGCGSDDEDATAAVQYKVLGGRLVWCSGGAEEMAVPGSASSIGNNAFNNCGAIGTLTIPASVTDIMRYTFSGVKVGKIIFGGTYDEWGAMTEKGGFGETLRGTPVICSDDKIWTWTAPAEPWEIEGGMVVRYTGSAADVTIPGEVTGIAGGAFAGHDELKHVVIPAGVTKIDLGAFAGSGITEIEYKGGLSAWEELVEAGGIADELDGITVTCDGEVWTPAPAHTHAWGETYTDDGTGGHYKICTDCDGHSATEAHTYGGYTDDENGKHYQVCSVCGGTSEAEAHDCEYKDNGDGTHTTTCTKCAYSQTAEEHRYENGMCLDCKCPQPTTVYVASTGSDDNSGSRSKPFATIQKAVDKIIAINDGASAYTIYVDGTLTQSAAPTGEGMADFSALDKNLTLTIKALSGTATLDANKLSRVINAAPASGALDLTLENLTITGGNTTGDGGGICFASGGTLTMESGAVSTNTAANGGGVYIAGGGTFTMNDGDISGNKAVDAGGGGVNVYDGTFDMHGGTISGNIVYVSDGGGGGVYVYQNSTFTFYSGTISGNTSNKHGGGIFVNDGTFTMNGGTIGGDTTGDKNTASSNGGGVYFTGTGKTFTMNDGDISGNRASLGGGVCIIRNNSFIMKNGTISNNETSASSHGGGVYVSGEFIMEDGTISGNTAAASGGGVCVYGIFTMKDGKIINNTANCKYMNSNVVGGGVALYHTTSEPTSTSGQFIMQGGVVSGNTSQAYGGGIYAYSQTEFTMTGGTISGNKSTDKDKGVGAYIYNKFNISGGAKFDESNDVYLDGWSNKINITDTLSESKVATITPSAYTAGRQVLSAGAGVTITQDICDKFAVTPQKSETDESVTEWQIVPKDDDSTAGVLKAK